MVQSTGHELAPRWHTAALIVLIVAVATTGAVLTSRGAALTPATSSRIATVYLPTILVQWALALYVCRIGRSHNAFPQLLGRRWDGVRRACGDIALAVSCWLLIEALELAYARAFGASTTTRAVLPHTCVERIMWVFVSGSVGLCEELVYRGYLQTQLAAFTGYAWAGVVLQAILFGIAHGEQGLAAVVRLGAYGVVLGALAYGRRSLLPGIACHVGINLASGLHS